MIHQVVPVIVEELTEFLQSRFGISEDQVVLGNVVNQDGSIAVEGNKLVVSLCNIGRDGSKGVGQHFEATGSTNPPVYINLYLIFSAVFNSSNINNQDYIEALKIISGVIGFFQGRNVFDHQNTPDMPDGANRVTLEIENIEFRELVNLWSLFGAKYTPSVVYRLRTLNMDEDLITDETPAVGKIHVGGSLRGFLR